MAEGTEEPRATRTLAVYPFAGTGDRPGQRCGHTLTTVLPASRDGSATEVLVLFGGATALQWIEGPNKQGAARLDGATNRTHLMDFATGQWTHVVPSGEAPPPRLSHGACGMGSTVVILGGLNEAGLVKDDLYMLDCTDAAHAMWRRASVNGPQSPGQRYGHVMALVENRFIVVSGGNNGRQLLSDTWVLDTTDKMYEWREVCHNGYHPQPRMYAACAARADGGLVVCGGRSAAGKPVGDSHTLVRNRDGEWTWIPGSVLPGGRFQHAAVAVHNGVYCSGGSMSVGTEVKENSFVACKPGTPWSPVPVPDASLVAIKRSRHAMAVVGPFIFTYGGLTEGKFHEDLQLGYAQSSQWEHRCPAHFPDAEPWARWRALVNWREVQMRNTSHISSRAASIATPSDVGDLSLSAQSSCADPVAAGKVSYVCLQTLKEEPAVDSVAGAKESTDEGDAEGPALARHGLGTAAVQPQQGMVDNAAGDGLPVDQGGKEGAVAPKHAAGQANGESHEAQPAPVRIVTALEQEAPAPASVQQGHEPAADAFAHVAAVRAHGVSADVAAHADVELAESGTAVEPHTAMSGTAAQQPLDSQVSTSTTTSAIVAALASTNPSDQHDGLAADSCSEQPAQVGDATTPPAACSDDIPPGPQTLAKTAPSAEAGPPEHTGLPALAGGCSSPIALASSVPFPPMEPPEGNYDDDGGVALASALPSSAAAQAQGTPRAFDAHATHADTAVTRPSATGRLVQLVARLSSQSLVDMDKSSSDAASQDMASTTDVGAENRAPGMPVFNLPVVQEKSFGTEGGTMSADGNRLDSQQASGQDSRLDEPSAKADSTLGSDGQATATTDLSTPIATEPRALARQEALVPCGGFADLEGQVEVVGDTNTL